MDTLVSILQFVPSGTAGLPVTVVSDNIATSGPAKIGHSTLLFDVYQRANTLQEIYAG